MPSLALPFRLAATLAIFAGVQGCAAGERTMAVWGEVSYDGSAITDGTICFFPIESTNEYAKGGKITGGKYRIEAGEGPTAGGVYQVRITRMEKVATNDPTKPVTVYANTLPATYSGDKSTLRATISKDPEANGVSFHLPAIAPTSIDAPR